MPQKSRNVCLTTEQKALIKLLNFLSILIENTLIKILRPSLLQSALYSLRYINFKTDKLISNFRILPGFQGINFHNTCTLNKMQLLRNNC